MFTETAQAIVELAKEHAAARAKYELDIESLLAAIGRDTEASVRLAQCLTGGDVAALQRKCPDLGHPESCTSKLYVAEALRGILLVAAELASGEGVPDGAHPGLVGIRHLACAMALSWDVCHVLGGVTPILREDALQILTAWYSGTEGRSLITDLMSDLRGLRSELLSKVFGQDHAIHAFVEGLYNAEVTAVADTERRRPAAVFVFAGPPGVGKTYLAELTSSILGRPFRRFDMTGYTDHQQHNQLIGYARVYGAAQPGLLTNFVAENPNAFLLFDEIEKAHLNTMQLFYQVLDAGRLEDKYREEEVSFRDTIIIFTTNAGRSLYDNPNKAGISAANSGYHKKTILSALENEKNPTTGEPAFPPAICSRIAQGYPLMFNHLGINELIQVSGVELARTGALLAKQQFKDFSYDPLLPICMVLREGGSADARQLRAETEQFVKTELFKYSSLYDERSLKRAFERFDSIRFEVEDGLESMQPESRALFQSPDKCNVLLVAGSGFVELCQQHVTEVNWFSASTEEEVIDILSAEDIDMVLLDIWVSRDATLSAAAAREEGPAEGSSQTFDFVPLSARELDVGRNILEKIHERLPQMPVYLLSHGRSAEKPAGEGGTSSFDITSDFGAELAIARPSIGAVDDELFLACVRAGGARGLVATDFVDTSASDWNSRASRFTDRLLEINHRLYREKKARSLAQEHKALVFDTSASVDSKNRQLLIRPCNFRLVRAIEASDAGEMVDDVHRPTTRFEDVIGAKGAKDSLQFIVDWFRNPKRYAALGVRPPKGILLGGPPGTGKTMLGRAVAGESNCAFLETSASSFVTKWQGSGPQNVRNLFERARRYAPAIIFIDEIDAIGKVRAGGAGSGRAEEETLNALLVEMDGFLGPALQPIIVLAATNLVEHLDEALTRRFDRIIEVDRPDRAARLKYLEKVVLERKGSKVSRTVAERIAGQSAGMTIADLERIVHEAAVMAAQQASGLTDEVLEEAFEKIRMGEASATPDQATLRRVAYHELGHAMIEWLGGKAPVQITIVGRGHAAGYVEKESDEQHVIYTKAEIEQEIRGLMGGRAAEIVYYGQEDGLSSGPSGDLQRATGFAQDMVSKFGMTKEFGQVALDSRTLHDGPLASRINDTVARIIGEQLDVAVQTLREHRESLDLLADKLLEKNRLTREDLEGILPPLGKGDAG